MTKAPQTRVQRIFGHLKRRSRNLETLPQWRVSSDVIGSADRVLGRIPVSTAKTEINAALGIIQGMEITGVSEETTRHQLEDHVRYLEDLLEPLAHTVSAEHIPWNIHYEMRKLGRGLHVSALKLISKHTVNSARRFFFNFNRNKETAVTAVEDIYDLRNFILEFKSALDRFRNTALPLYAVSPIEATMLSFGGFMSNSLCDLDKFIDWMLEYRQFVDSQFGFVQSVHVYREYVDGNEIKPHWAVEESIIIGVENIRGIQNWVRVKTMLMPGIDVKSTASARGFHHCQRDKNVSFATTKEVLERGAYSSGGFVMHKAMPMTSLATYMKCAIDTTETPSQDNHEFGTYLAKFGEYIQNSLPATNRVNDLFAVSDFSEFSISVSSSTI